LSSLAESGAHAEKKASSQPEQSGAKQGRAGQGKGSRAGQGRAPGGPEVQKACMQQAECMGPGAWDA